jgi:rubredoxin
MDGWIRFAPRALIAVGACFVCASIILQYGPSTNLVISQKASPKLQVHQLTTSRAPGGERKGYLQVPAAATSAVSSIAAARGEGPSSAPIPWVAASLSLGLLVGAVSAFGVWRRGSTMPLDEEVPVTLTEIAMLAVAGEQLITVEKPLGLTLGEKKSGGIEVTFVNPLGNAAKAGMKGGDTVVYHSSFFGDELWPADKLSFVKSSINACPNQVDFIIVRGAAAEQVNVKRLSKRPAPPKIGRKLTAAQKARATHVCLDCGWVYALPTAFEEQPKEYRCPQCQATKSRFSRYDVETGRILGSSALPEGILQGVVAGVAVVALLAYVATSL